MSFILEICAGTIRSAIAAQSGGADRIELCDNLASGGTTPSFGMIFTAKKLLNIPIFPIIRPRGGDFFYSKEEFEIMKKDVICCNKLGCEGLVLGMLNRDGSIDKDRCYELIALARPMQVSFHRAFDRCNDLEKGLEEIIGLGCDRVLSSGGERYAFDGIQRLKALAGQAGKRISIMPGSGITDKNIAEIARETGTYEFHGTAKKLFEYGTDPVSKESFQSFETADENVSKLKEILAGIR